MEEWGVVVRGREGVVLMMVFNIKSHHRDSNHLILLLLRLLVACIIIGS